MVKVEEGYAGRAVRNVEDSLRRIENNPDFNSDLAVMQAGQQNVLLTAIHLQVAVLVELVGKGAKGEADQTGAIAERQRLRDEAPQTGMRGGR